MMEDSTDEIEILAEWVVKLENEGGKQALKSEVKDEDNEQEELKPPISVFVDSELVATAGVSWEQEDPLAMCNGNFLGKSKVGGEYDLQDTFVDSKTKMGTNVVKCNEISKKGSNLTHVHAGVEFNKKITHRKNTIEDASHFPKQNNNNITLADEHFISRPSSSSVALADNGCKDRITKKKGKCHECSLCQKSFPTRSLLARHIQTHSVGTNECSICHKNFSQKSLLVMHMRIHSGERLHECSLCQKSFSEKSDLETHMQIHMYQHPHKCSVCSKGFKWRSVLNKHMLSHNKEGSFECDICEKTFSQKSALVTHKRVHVENSFACDECEKSFSQKSALGSHKRIHSDTYRVTALKVNFNVKSAKGYSSKKVL